MHIVAALIAAALLLPSAGPARAAWDVAHGDSANSGFAAVDTAPAGRGSLSVPGLGTIAAGAGPVIGPDGTVYIGTVEGWLIALRPDGKPYWKRDITPAGQSIVASPAVGGDGTIYVIGIKQYDEQTAKGPRKKYESRLHRFLPGGGYLGSTPFPEHWNGGTTVAPPNIWRSQGVEFVIVPAIYHSTVAPTYDRHLIAFSASGAVVGDQKVSTFVPQTTGGAGLSDLGWARCIIFTPVPIANIPMCAPWGFDQSLGGKRVPPMPGVAVFTHAGGGTPHILMSDHEHAVTDFTFSQGAGFTRVFAAEDKSRLMRSPPMVLPDAHTVIGQQNNDYGKNGAVFFAGPNMIKWAPVTGMGAVLAAPTRTVGGLVVAVEAGKGIAALRDGKIVSRAPIGDVSLASAAASRTHVFVAGESALITYDAAAQTELMRFPWVGGGLWQPVIGPQGHVYAIASNILFVFPPPRQLTMPRVEQVTGVLEGATIATAEPVVAPTPETTPPPTPAGGLQRYKDPKGPTGLRLYACTAVGGSECERPVAVAFCQGQGYAKAGKYDTDNKKTKAETLSGEVCTKKRCRVFEYIDCVN